MRKTLEEIENQINRKIDQFREKSGIEPNTLYISQILLDDVVMQMDEIPISPIHIFGLKVLTDSYLPPNQIQVGRLE